MAVTMSDDAVWSMLSEAEKGVFVSLRRSGSPVALPVWFVAHDRAIWVRTPVRSAKLARVRQDGRVAFLVDDGRAWAELRGVHVSGVARVVEDGATRERVGALIEAKYAHLRTAPAAMSDATRRHYAERALIRITPDTVISWDNHLLRGANPS